MVTDLFGKGLKFAWVEKILLNDVDVADWNKVREYLVSSCCEAHFNLLTSDTAEVVNDVLKAMGAASDAGPQDDRGVPQDLVEFTKSQDFILFLAKFMADNPGENIFDHPAYLKVSGNVFTEVLRLNQAAAAEGRQLDLPDFVGYFESELFELFSGTWSKFGARVMHHLRDKGEANYEAIVLTAGAFSDEDEISVHFSLRAKYMLGLLGGLGPASPKRETLQTLQKNCNALTAADLKATHKMRYFKNKS